MKNNRGMTLIEVLAALTLSIIVFAAISTALTSILKSTTLTREKINLSQEVNLILLQLEQFHKKYKPYKLKYNNDQIYVGTNKADIPLSGGRVSVTELKIDDQTISQSANEIDMPNSTYWVEFTVSDPESNQQFRVKSKISRMEDKT